MFRGFLKLSFPLLVIPSFLIVMCAAVGIVLLAVDLVWSREHRLAWAVLELIISHWPIALSAIGASALWLVATARVAINLLSPRAPGLATLELGPEDVRARETALSGSQG